MTRRIGQLDLDDLFTVDEARPSGTRPVNTATDSVDEWVGDGRKRERPRRRPRASGQAMSAYIEDASARAKSGEWGDVNGEQVGPLMVALYIICHERVYGVRPLEVMAPEEFPTASLAAKRLHVDVFNADLEAMVEFVRWAWDRERGREQWRAENHQETRRVGWRLQFGLNSALLTDYKVSQVKARRRG